MNKNTFKRILPIIIVLLVIAIGSYLFISSQKQSKDIQSADSYWAQGEYVIAANIYNEYCSVNEHCNERLNEYFTMLSKIIFNHEFTKIDKYGFTSITFQKDKEIYRYTFDSKINESVEDIVPIIRWDNEVNAPIIVGSGADTYLIDACIENKKLYVKSLIFFDHNQYDTKLDWYYQNGKLKYNTIYEY